MHHNWDMWYDANTRCPPSHVSVSAPHVGSVPAGESRNRYGHMGLRRFLAAEEFDRKFRGAPIIAQFSSMGSLSHSWLQEFTASLSAGRIADAGSRGAPVHRRDTARHLLSTGSKALWGKCQLASGGTVVSQRCADIHSSAITEFPPPALGEPSGGRDAAPGLQIIWTAEDEVRQRAAMHGQG